MPASIAAPQDNHGRDRGAGAGEGNASALEKASANCCAVVNRAAVNLIGDTDRSVVEPTEASADG